MVVVERRWKSVELKLSQLADKGLVPIVLAIMFSVRSESSVKVELCAWTWGREAKETHPG